MNLYETMLAIFLMIFLSLRSLFDYFRGYFKSWSYTHNKKTQIKVGLLTNEIPPIVYGGVATWIVNFISMFEGDDRVTVIPIFLAYNDALPEKCYNKYKDIRVIEKPEDINECFADIDVCVNNLWIALETIIQIKEEFPCMNIVSVCHSLIRMENITNMGSCYTSNFNQQEITFQHSDYVVLISKAEKDYYNQFGYNLFDTKTKVIYNSYQPKYDDTELDINYSSNTLGYIGRHVPRKRPEIPIVSINQNNIEGISVVNMGVDYDKYDNAYWRILEKKYEESLKIIPFTSDKTIKEQYWKEIGINCITGIYEPFGYTICECLDRRVPVIVSNIDGPKEIVEEVVDHVYTYEVDVDNYQKDIQNFTQTLRETLSVDPEVRKHNANRARKALDKLRPENIKEDWIVLLTEILD
uniref:Glycosyl transferase family 1 domain-containing protein n=1 Tax=viral metagenome TaxID=1070528 RepID=A0A6C0F838_9ZZZZ